MTAELSAEFERRFPGGPRIQARLTVPTDRFSITVLFGPSGSGKTTIGRSVLGLVKHLGEYGIGSIAEVFDATEPYTARGCIAQAWSVAEVLRCWVKTDGQGSGEDKKNLS